MTVRQFFISITVAVVIAVLLISLIWPNALWLFVIVIPIFMMGNHDLKQTNRSLLRLYPVVGRIRYLFEHFRPEIQQYFIEDDTNGKPISREFRSLVYQRSKGARDTRPFGTVFDVYRPGYEWLNHSLAPCADPDKDPRVMFGEGRCKKPYAASVLNISAMSYGALSKNAIMALNRGAKEGRFAHNTGEGGVSPYHLKYGGDLIWQIGTGYFGCRKNDGTFNPEGFVKTATRDEVKMIEIKISQGAKPGHGGILPAAKVTQEIVEIRHVEMGKDVISPPTHSSFSTPMELLKFVEQLRDLSEGKPVGFKLCIGYKVEFLSICRAMLDSGILPDFITVDGSEGGTGAAPIEFTNSVGTPLLDAVHFVNSALIGVGLRDKIRIIAAGKVISAFQMSKVMALGADTINSARGMMFALGCIQSRHCNTDKCPTGIATQDPNRYLALDVEDKSKRVKNFQNSIIHHLVELLAAAGLPHSEGLQPWHINRRVGGADTRNYSEIYHQMEPNGLNDPKQLPDNWKRDWDSADKDVWCAGHSAYQA